MAYIPSCTQISISILQKQPPSTLHTSSYQHLTALTLLPLQPNMQATRQYNAHPPTPNETKRAETLLAARQSQQEGQMSQQSGRKNGFAERRGEALHWGKMGE